MSGLHDIELRLVMKADTESEFWITVFRGMREPAKAEKLTSLVSRFAL